MSRQAHTQQVPVIIKIRHKEDSQPRLANLPGPVAVQGAQIVVATCHDKQQRRVWNGQYSRQGLALVSDQVSIIDNDDARLGFSALCCHQIHELLGEHDARQHLVQWRATRGPYENFGVWELLRQHLVDCGKHRGLAAASRSANEHVLSCEGFQNIRIEVTLVYSDGYLPFFVTQGEVADHLFGLHALRELLHQGR